MISRPKRSNKLPVSGVHPEKSPAILNSIAYEWVAVQREPTCIFTDIDDSFIDRAGRPAAREATKQVRAWALKARSPLVLVSGLQVKTIRDRVATGEIPEPEIIIGDVGTDIWFRGQAGTWRRDKQYAAQLAAANFRKNQVITAAAAFMHSQDAKDELVFQPHHRPYKVSLYFMGDDARAATLAAKAQAAFPKFKIVTCKEIHHNAALPPQARRYKYCLDIVPATKADALNYVCHQLAITAGFKAGDSGNDIAMLLNNDPLVPILVGGYKTEALTALQPHIASSADAPFYTLKDGRQCFIETGARVGAQSILFAIQHYTSCLTEAGGA